MKRSSTQTRQWSRFARHAHVYSLTLTPRTTKATPHCGSIFVLSTSTTPSPPLILLHRVQSMLFLHVPPVSPRRSYSVCCFRQWRLATGRSTNSTISFFDTFSVAGFQRINCLAVLLWPVF